MKYLPLLLLLAACASNPYDSLNAYLQKRAVTPPTANSFQSCRAYGCQKIDTIELTDSKWKEIDTIFNPPAKSAEQEREKISKALASFETIVGDITGTSEDIWGTFQKTGHKQQDCVDESTNSSIYMRVLEKRGHLKFHIPRVPQSRVLFMRWPHQTAVITEIETGQEYAVDSWFHNNGKPAEIIELDTWKKGWKPEKAPKEDRS